MKDLTALNKCRDKRGMLLSISFYGPGEKGNGVFNVRTFKSGRRFQVIATDGGGWDHVSVCPLDHPNKLPTWDEMCEIKDMFFEPEEECVEYHPRKSEYVNLKSNCLHLWRPNDGREFINPLREAKERLEEDRQAAMERWGL